MVQRHEVSFVFNNNTFINEGHTVWITGNTGPISLELLGYFKDGTFMKFNNSLPENKKQELEKCSRAYKLSGVHPTRYSSVHVLIFDPIMEENKITLKDVYAITTPVSNPRLDKDFLDPIANLHHRRHEPEIRKRLGIKTCAISPNMHKYLKQLWETGKPNKVNSHQFISSPISPALT